MATLSAQLQSLRTEIDEILGIATLQTASNLETESLMREISKNIADFRGAVYKSLYNAYGRTIVSSDRKKKRK
jgi:surface polysaccharide O-acyltransferase-like enzyme